MSTDIHNKIIHLLELAKSNNEEEAASAANMAAKLMLKYNIEQKDLGVVNTVEYSEVHTLDRDYFRILGHAVREMTAVQMVLYNHQESYRLVGTKVNTQIAHSLLLFLAEQVEHLYKSYLPPGMSKADRAKYRKDFKRNCAMRIYQRTQEQAFHVGPNTSTALVHIKQDIEREVEDFLTKMNVKYTRTRTKINTHTKGALDGRVAGNAARLQKGIQH